jgi:3-methyladenine DNA glycosylase/8-oxoguanine DNA glycosylase
MNLLTNEILDQTKLFWSIKTHAIYHNAISLVISQKVSFKVGRSIRTKLFSLIGLSEFTKDNIKQLTESEMLNVGLDKNKIILINAITKLNDSDNLIFINEISKLKGIGIWTIKALKILNLDDSDIFLAEDLWIRKRLSELMNHKTTLTIQECNNLSNTIKINKTHISKFLWRIKPEGIIALKNKQILNINHFL